MQQHTLCQNLRYLRGLLITMGIPPALQYVVSDTAVLHWDLTDKQTNAPAVTLDIHGKVMVWAGGAPDAAFHISSAHSVLGALSPILAAGIGVDSAQTTGAQYRTTVSQMPPQCRHTSSEECPTQAVASGSYPPSRTRSFAGPEIGYGPMRTLRLI
jgi:hypothetical protein